MSKGFWDKSKSHLPNYYSYLLDRP